jgi:hypothetical protein
MDTFFRVNRYLFIHDEPRKTSRQGCKLSGEGDVVPHYGEWAMGNGEWAMVNGEFLHLIFYKVK